jgi:hypothetical protein
LRMPFLLTLPLISAYALLVSTPFWLPRFLRCFADCLDGLVESCNHLIDFGSSPFQDGFAEYTSFTVSSIEDLDIKSSN